MPRALILILLLTAACGRRETVAGNWTGVATPDAAPLSTPTADQVSGPTPQSPDAGGGSSKSATDLAPPPPGELQPPDAAGSGPEVRAAAPGLGETVDRDASSDVGDARPCPDADRCD